MRQSAGFLSLLFLAFLPVSLGQAQEAGEQISVETALSRFSSAVGQARYSDARELNNAIEQGLTKAEQDLTDGTRFRLDHMVRGHCLSGTATAISACRDFLSLALNDHPGNYFFRNTLATLQWINGNASLGFDMGNEAYESFSNTLGAHLPTALLQVPLYGQLKVATSWNNPKVRTHTGLWRYGMDIKIVNRKNKNISMDKPVHAPAPGKVLEIFDQHPTDTYMAIDIGNGLRVALVHIKPGSATVKAGDMVATGDVVATIGKANHLHLQVNTKYNVSVPFVFRSYSIRKGGEQRLKVPGGGALFSFENESKKPKK
jgi:hypothetical protein